MSGYTVVRLNRENCADLAQLYQAAHGRKISAQHFRQKYNTTYTGHVYTGLLVYDQAGKPVAFSGLLPCLITLKDQQVLAAQQVDIMTHPQHRLKGMFVELSERLYALGRELGIVLLFGFPNQHSYHGVMNRLNWKQEEQLDAFMIPVKPSWFARAMRKTRFIAPFYRLHKKRLLKKYITTDKGLPCPMAAAGFATVDRSPAYLDWKSCSETLVVRAGNARVWMADRSQLMIGEMEVVTEETLPAVLKDLKKIARQLGITGIQFHCSPSGSLHAVWKAHVPARASYPVVFQDFGSAIPPEKIKFSFADIDVF